MVDEKLTKAQAELLAEACQRGKAEVGFNPPVPRRMANQMVGRGLLKKDGWYFLPTAEGKALWEMAQRIAANR